MDSSGVEVGGTRGGPRRTEFPVGNDCGTAGGSADPRGRAPCDRHHPSRGRAMRTRRRTVHRRHADRTCPLIECRCAVACVQPEDVAWTSPTLTRGTNVVALDTLALVAEGNSPAFLAEAHYDHDGDGGSPSGRRQGKAVVAAPARR